MNPPTGIGVAPYCEMFGEPRQERAPRAEDGGGVFARADPQPGCGRTGPRRRTARSYKGLAWGGGGQGANGRQIRSVFDAPGIPQMAGRAARRDQHHVESRRQLGQVGTRQQKGRRGAGDAAALPRQHGGGGGV